MAQAFAFVAVAAIVSTGVSYLFPSDGPRIKDLSVAASTYGNIIPEVYGTTRVAGNMIWATPIKENKKKKRAGKGGSYYNDYTYTCDFAMSFAKGPVQEVRRIWADGKIIYDVTGQSEVINANKYRMRVYMGTEDQVPDTLIQADKGVDYAPAYRGLCYVVFDDFLLTDFGNRIPQMAAEVYVGEDGDSAITDFTFFTNTGDNKYYTSYQLPEVIYDYDRGYLYLLDQTSNPNGTNAAGLRRIRIPSGVEDRQQSFPVMNPTTGNIYDDGSVTNLCGITHKGELLVVMGGVNNYMEVAKLDPNTLYPIASIGRSAPGFPDEIPVWGMEYSGKRMPSAEVLKTSKEYCLTLGIFGGCNIICTDQAKPDGDPSMDWQESYRFECKSNPSGVVDGNSIACGRAPISELPVFYIIGSEGDFPTHFSIERATLGGSAIVGTVPVANPGQAASTSWCFWDNGNPGVVFFSDEGSDRFITKWSEDTGQIAWKTPLPNGATPPVWAMTAEITNNELAWTGGVPSKLWIINTSTGEWVDRELNQDFYLDDDDRPAEQDVGNTGGVNGFPLPRQVSDSALVYDPMRGVVIALGGGGAEEGIVHVGKYATEQTTVGGIVERLLRLNGQMNNADFDLTPLYDIPVRGYGYAASTDIKSILADLRNLFMFDLVESDGQLKAKVRGSDVADLNLSYKALASTSGGDDDANYWKETRASESDLPASIDLVYMNIDNDFQAATARSKRIVNPYPTMLSRQQAKMEASLVMDATEAKNRVNVMLYAAWEERTKHETSLPWAYAHLDAADLISVTMADGRNYFERVSSIEFGADFSSRLESYGTDSGAYLSDKTGDGGAGGRPTVVEVPKPAIAFLMNLPLLRDQDDTGGSFSNYYSALGNAAPGAFNGAALFRATNGIDYDLVYQEPEGAEWGTVIGTVPPPSRGDFALDWETKITIYPAVDWFELESITDDELWAGANYCVIGNEVIQFRDAVENADGSWTIWNLLRCRRGTEWAGNAHREGEFFLFLDANTVTPQGEALDSANKFLWFKAVGAGRSPDTSNTQVIQYWPRDLMPYAVTDVRRTFNGPDIDITWKRRTRMGGGMQDGTGVVPLSETSEAYELYILSPDDLVNSQVMMVLGSPVAPDLYRRKLTLTDPNFTYTAAMMAEDVFDVNLDTLYVMIYQLSSTVGRGFQTFRWIEPWRVF